MYTPTHYKHEENKQMSWKLQDINKRRINSAQSTLIIPSLHWE